MCNTDYDWPDFHSEKLIKARKEHACSECGRTIRKHETYSYVCGKWNGDFNVFKTCQHCCVLQNWLFQECGGFLHQGLQEEIQEHAHDYRTMFLYRGLIGIGRKWKKRNSDGLMPILNLTTMEQ